MSYLNLMFISLWWSCDWFCLLPIFFLIISEKQIDFKTVDLKKLKVRDLKKILADWDEDCEGCLEKTDYIKRINELKPKYVKDEL